MPGPGLSGVPLTVANGVNVTKKGTTTGINVNTGNHVTVKHNSIYANFGGRRNARNARKTRKSKTRKSKSRKTRR